MAQAEEPQIILEQVLENVNPIDRPHYRIVLRDA